LALSPPFLTLVVFGENLFAGSNGHRNNCRRRLLQLLEHRLNLYYNPIMSRALFASLIAAVFYSLNCSVFSPYDIDASHLRALIRPAPFLKFPMGQDSTDCNSPAHWDKDTLFLFNSFNTVHRAKGSSIFHLNKLTTSVFDTQANGNRWIESTWKDENGQLYAWYHNEPGGLCPESDFTAPRIGAAVSTDNGRTFRDLGFIIETRDTINCNVKNGFFAGGNGDFSVLPDSARENFYFFYTAYAGDVSEQGMVIARMSYADRDDPVGKVWKWYNGEWNEPGLKGKATPVLQAVKNWAEDSTDGFWGPSIHWNTHIHRYVILLNRAKGPPGFAQEGIYITYNPDISDPLGWTKPVRIYREGFWLPQIIGIDSTKQETDKFCGRVARFFMDGISQWEMVFLNPGEFP
jgi:hypothetical protein